MTRHQMRQSAFMLIFERIFNSDPIDSLLETAAECETVELNEAVIRMFQGVEEKKDILDQEIEKHLKNWTLSRISKVSLAVLRLAMYEILFAGEVEADIAISEAVKIAQEFTGKEDVKFVNGVLSSVSKSLISKEQKEEDGVPAGEKNLDNKAAGEDSTGENPDSGLPAESGA